jgi:hypothetical protein
MVLLGVVIVLETNKGTITIECARNDIPVRITSGGELVRELTVNRGENSVRIAAGEYRVEIEGKHDELIVEKGAVTLKRGGEWVAKIVEKPAPGDDGAVVSQMPAGTPLADAVRELNRQTPLIDAKVAALTGDEVVSSARWALRNAPSEAIESALRAVAEHQVVPQGWRIDGNASVDAGWIQSWKITLVSADDKSSHVIRRRIVQRLAADGTPLKLPEPAATEEDGVPLAAAIHEFNQRWGTTKLGKDQPPLTEEEVVAAIEDWKSRRNEAPVTNAEFADFTQIAETRLLPLGTAELELLTSFAPGDGYEYDRWSIRIVTRRTAKPGWTYAFEIRDRFLGVRKSSSFSLMAPPGEFEKGAEDIDNVFNQDRIRRPGSGLPRGPYQRRPLGATKEGGSTASPEERKSEEEIEKTLGTWVLDGTEDDAEPETIEFERSGYNIRRGGGVFAGGFAETIEFERSGYNILLEFTDVAGRRKTGLANLSPSADPPRFNLAVLSISGAPTWVGNYKVEGDTLSLEFTGVTGLRGRPLDWPEVQKLDDSPRTFQGKYHRKSES